MTTPHPDSPPQPPRPRAGPRSGPPAPSGAEPRGGEAVETRAERRVRKPRLYKVLLHNDDYTTMEFVVWILVSVFRHEEPAAVAIMLHVHQRGMGVAGVFSREVAETRVAQVSRLARQHEFPLRCTMEPA